MPGDGGSSGSDFAACGTDGGFAASGTDRGGFAGFGYGGRRPVGTGPGGSDFADFRTGGGPGGADFAVSGAVGIRSVGTGSGGIDGAAFRTDRVGFAASGPGGGFGIPSIWRLRAGPATARAGGDRHRSGRRARPVVVRPAR
ncbi:hypothetical protein [Streptomyces sp. BBFR109]|uniref:hypothetical protein n=1 Tax=Streptomyces sp. BBFR109 TaxID=3448172 RepID=UPI003F7612BF